MTSVLERPNYRTDLQDELPDPADLDAQVANVRQSLHDAAIAVQENPHDEGSIAALEQQSINAGNLARTNPEVADKIIAPLGEAVQALYRYDSNTEDDKTDERVVATLAEIAADVPPSISDKAMFIRIAAKKINEFYSRSHAASNDVGAELDNELVGAFIQAIKDTTREKGFKENLNWHTVQAYNKVASHHVDMSEAAEYRRIKLLEKSARVASFAHNGRDMESETEQTGFVYKGNPGAVYNMTPGMTTEEAVKDPLAMPKMPRQEEFENDDEYQAALNEWEPAQERWRLKLQNMMTNTLGQRAMRDATYDRMVTDRDIHDGYASIDGAAEEQLYRLPKQQSTDEEMNVMINTYRPSAPPAFDQQKQKAA